MSSQIKSTFFANSSHPTLLKIWCKNLKWFSSNIYLMAPWLQICPIIITQFMFPSWSTRDFKSDQKSLNINHHIFDRGSLLILGQSNLHTQLRYKFGYFCKDLKFWSTTPNATEHGRQKQNIELALFLHQNPDWIQQLPEACLTPWGCLLSHHGPSRKYARETNYTRVIRKYIASPIASYTKCSTIIHPKVVLWQKALILCSPNNCQVLNCAHRHFFHLSKHHGVLMSEILKYCVRKLAW